jgi:NAD(P)-dependent dehydrogenase (short-subunit alcohol dehydrogenase family)
MNSILAPGFVDSLFQLDGRVAAVTGGGSGLGAAICAGLAQAGAHVAVIDIDIDAAASVSTAISGDGGKATALACDVTKGEAVKRAVRSVLDIASRVDVLINSAGTAFRHPAESFPEDEFDRVIEVNLKGTYLACQAFGAQMLEGAGGSIINIASIGGFVAYPDAAAYLASKGGVVQLTRALALEWIGRVRVNGIAPTLFDTPLTSRGAVRSTRTSDFITARVLRDGVAHPRQVVGAAIFLASDASELVTGHTLPVDDGYLIA